MSRVVVVLRYICIGDLDPDLLLSTKACDNSVGLVNPHKWGLTGQGIANALIGAT